MTNITKAVFLSVAIANYTGCMHLELRKHTNQQLRTVSEVTQQQIMDNVAKVAANENGWPEYSSVTQGATQISDDAGASREQLSIVVF